MSEGHFTCYSYHAELGVWLWFNDTRVTQTSKTRLSEQQAYILFYQRRENEHPDDEDEEEEEEEEDEDELDDADGEDADDGRC